MVSFSSDESESYAIEAPNVNRWETLDHRRKKDHRIGANPETRAEDVAERAVQAVEKVPDKTDSLNKEAKCTRKSKEKLLGARKALGPSAQEATIAHEKKRLAEVAIPVVRSCFRGSQVARQRASRQDITGADHNRECEGELELSLHEGSGKRGDAKPRE